MTRLRAARALVGGALVGPIVLELTGSQIRTVRPAREGDVVDIDLVGGTLTAGLLDVQVNGSFGIDVARADPGEWRTLLAGLASRGVTGVQPTVITAPLDDVAASVDRIGRARDAFAHEPVARVLGAHVEGPFLSPARAGAHRVDHLLRPTRENLDALLDAPGVRAALRTVTLAPELPGGLEAVRRLTGEGVVVAVGHSDATAAEVHAAGDAGATMCTHVFNAQRPLSAREPGVPGAVLADDRFFVGTILDGHHVAPTVVALALAAAERRIVGVTDAIVTAGLAPGTRLAFGGQPVEVDGTGLGRRPDGTIAGAGIVLDEGVRRMIAAGLDPAAVLTACTESAARSLGRTDIGHVAEGALADLVWWDAAWHPSRVWIGGRALAVAEP